MVSILHGKFSVFVNRHAMQINRKEKRMKFAGVLFVFLIPLFIAWSCRQAPDQQVRQKSYPEAIIGDWQGTLGDYYKETITFRKDSTFRARIRSGGFIGNTISQGIQATARGMWKIRADKLTLEIERRNNDDLFDKTPEYSILSFYKNEIKLRDARGDTTIFVRIKGL